MRKSHKSIYVARSHAAFEITMAALGFLIAWEASSGIKQWDMSRHEHVIVAACVLLAVLFGIVALLFFMRSVSVLRRMASETSDGAQENIEK